MNIQQLQITSQLFMFRDATINKIIGYVCWNPDEKAWFWMYGNHISELFNSHIVATDALSKAYLMRKYDLTSNKKIVSDDNKTTNIN